MIGLARVGLGIRVRAMSDATSQPHGSESAFALGRRARRILGVVFAVYVALVATHEGEFFPFSIYPMFSQAGKPWTRSAVYELSKTELAELDFAPRKREDMPGRPFAAGKNGINVIDLAKFISMAERFDDGAVQSLRKMAGPELADKRLVFVRVSGHLMEEQPGEVALQFQPVVAIAPEGARVHPDLR